MSAYDESMTLLGFSFLLSRLQTPKGIISFVEDFSFCICLFQLQKTSAVTYEDGLPFISNRSGQLLR